MPATDYDLTSPRLQRAKASYETYLAFPSDTRFVDWGDGEMLIYPTVTLAHQELVGFLLTLLASYCEPLHLGHVMKGPFEVKLWPGGPSRTPDLLYIGPDKRLQLGRQRFDGAPDLVIEIVSPGSVREDKVRKFAEYEQAGVGEYWIIDSRPRQESAEFYRRDEAGIFQPIEIGEDGRVASTVLPRFWLNVDWLRCDRLPLAHAALADIFAANDTFPAELSDLYRRLAALEQRAA